MADLPDHYHLKSEDKDHFVIHDKRDKKEFKIAKKGIHPAHQLNILRLQKYAEGTGDVEDTGEDGIDEGAKPTEAENEEGFTPAPEVPPEQQPQTQAPPPGQMPDILPPVATPRAVGEGSVLAPQSQIQGQAQTTGDSSAPSQTTGAQPPANYPTSADLKGYLGQAVSAQKAIATAEQKQNDAVVAQQQKNLAAEQKYLDDQALKMNDYQKSYNDLWKKTMDQEIDPQKYWSSKDSHAKMRAGIGILLSGLSGASNNMAMDVINKNIDRDIEAQKANLGKKQSLLSHNLAMQGNLLQATNMTRMQMQAMSEGQLRLTAAKMGNPLISARANLATAQMMQNAYPSMVNAANNDVQMQIRKEVMQKLAQKDEFGQHDVDLHDLSRAGLVDKATAEKESAAISKRQQAEAYLVDQVGKLDKEQRVWGEGNIVPNIINPGSYSRRDQFRAGIIQAIQSASPSKRLNPEMLAIEAEPFLTKTFESEQTRESGLNGLLGLIRSHADPTPMATHYKVKGAISGSNSVPKNYKMGPVK
jgi:hypothetical protein